MSRVPNGVRPIPLMVILTAALAVGVSAAHAGVCKATGAQCQTAVSCCSRNCAKPFVKHGAALFGLCCPASDSLCNGVCVNLATDSKNCGACGTTCTAPDTCGGGGTAGQCGCTPTVTCASEGFDCGSLTNDCGETVPCGTCEAPAVCGASTPNVCGTTTTTSTTIPTTTSTTEVVTTTTTTTTEVVTTTTETTTTMLGCSSSDDCPDQSTVCQDGACVPCLAAGAACDQTGGEPCCVGLGCSDTVPVFCDAGSGFCCHD